MVKSVSNDAQNLSRVSSAVDTLQSDTSDKAADSKLRMLLADATVKAPQEDILLMADALKASIRNRIKKNTNPDLEAG
ncbi:MAG: hypothetical protein AAGG48_14585 [Planctomycetota bacterium]